MKRMLVGFMTLLLILQTGCWDYRSLSEINIVAGLALDKDPENGQYILTAEVLDLNVPTKDQPPKSVIIESIGETLFDAARNAKRKLRNKLYFSNTSVFILSRQIAAEEGVYDYIDWLSRDLEPRSTINVAVSKEETAGELLKAKMADNSIVSFTLQNIIEEDKKVTASTVDAKVSQIYNIINTDGESLALPAFHLVQNNGEAVNEVNGVAIFRNDLLCGFLTPEETRIFLIINDEIEGGLYSFQNPQKDQIETVIEIADCKTKRSFAERNGEIHFTIEPKLKVYLAEVDSNLSVMDEKTRKLIQTTAQDDFKKDILALCEKVQKLYLTDIFGFGNEIYRKDPGYWDKIKGDWDNIFPGVKVQVNVTVDIVNTALIH